MKLNIKSVKIENMTIKNIESRITICWENKVITCNLSDVEIEVE